VLIEVTPEVQEALESGGPVVALETTLVAHGFPPGEGAEVGLASERRVREAGAIPATVGVLDGKVRVGLSEAELARFTTDARKAGPRDIAACAVQGAIGATTVGGTLAVCRSVGIRVLGTGGIGGVHRDPRDVSPDLLELVQVCALVVCSGAKSILDVAATAEFLESLGIPALGYRTDTLPRFYTADGGPPVSARVESPEEAAAVTQAHWELANRGVLLANPPAQSLDDIDPLIERAVAEAGARGISGQALTPFLLGFLHRESGGRTLETNRRLVEDNAGLAAEVAVAHSRA
jgi:pseudouridine-5'-phosphate glycosidase